MMFYNIKDPCQSCRGMFNVVGGFWQCLLDKFRAFRAIDVKIEVHSLESGRAYVFPE
jgi:hypothetical protein